MHREQPPAVQQRPEEARASVDANLRPRQRPMTYRFLAFARPIYGDDPVRAKSMLRTVCFRASGSSLHPSFRPLNYSETRNSFGWENKVGYTPEQTIQTTIKKTPCKLRMPTIWFVAVRNVKNVSYLFRLVDEKESACYNTHNIQMVPRGSTPLSMEHSGPFVGCCD